ncbi:unnamed protein product, partial [Amoebophrya sp. A120]
ENNNPSPPPSFAAERIMQSGQQSPGRFEPPSGSSCSSVNEPQHLVLATEALLCLKDTASFLQADVLELSETLLLHLTEELDQHLAQLEIDARGSCNQMHYACLQQAGEGAGGVGVRVGASTILSSGSCKRS